MMQRQGEAQHERLGGGVGRHKWHRLERRRGGDIDHGALARRDHVGHEQMRQFHQRADVEVDLLSLPLQWQMVEAAAGTESGVIDQQVELDARTSDLFV